MHSITELRPVPEGGAPAPDGFGEPFAGFGGTGFWRNLNMDPHAPTVGRLIEALYERVTGVPIDGVIFVDPQALADMLEATGPIDDPTLDRTWRPRRSSTTWPTRRTGSSEAGRTQAVLGAAVLSVLRRFLAGTDPVASFRALADAGAGGHLIVHSRIPRSRRPSRPRGRGNRRGPQVGDVFGAFAPNADGTKIDFYVRRSLSYRVDLGEGGGSTAQVALTAENTAPRIRRELRVRAVSGNGARAGGVAGVPLDVLRPRLRIPGRHLDGKPQDLELVVNAALGVLDLRADRAGDHERTGAELQRADAWTGDEFGGTYRLRIRRSRRSCRRGERSRSRRPRNGIVDATPGMQVEVARATWRARSPPCRNSRSASGRPWAASGTAFDARVRGGRPAGDARIGRVGTVEQVPGRHEHLRPLEDDLRSSRVGPPRPPVVGFAVAQHAHDEREAERALNNQPARRCGTAR